MNKKILKYNEYYMGLFTKFHIKLPKENPNKVRDANKVLREFRGHVSGGFRGLRSLIMPVDVPMIDGGNFGGKISRRKTFARPTRIYSLLVHVAVAKCVCCSRR